MTSINQSTNRSTNHLMVVLANAAPGRDDDLDRWYEDHVDRVLAVAGVAAARRYVNVRQHGDPCEHRYLTVYELSADDLDDAVAALAAARADMPSTDAIADARVWFFSAHADPLVEETTDTRRT